MSPDELDAMASLAYGHYHHSHSRFTTGHPVRFPDLYPFEKQPVGYKSIWLGLVHLIITLEDLRRSRLPVADYQI